MAQDTSHHEERSYGLVLALQVSLPIVAVHAVQSLNAEFPDHAQPLFQFCLSEVQYTLAAEDSLQDVRWAALDSIADMIFISIGPQAVYTTCLLGKGRNMVNCQRLSALL